MGTLYRPKTTTYKVGGKTRMPDGNKVTRDTPGAEPVVTASPSWWGRWTDAAGRRQQRKLSQSKDTARRMLRKLEGDAQLAGVGIVDRYADHKVRPLPEHLDDYRKHLENLGRNAVHVQHTVSQCKAVIWGCGWETTEDVGDDAVEQVMGYLATLREGGAPAKVPAKAEFTAKEAAVLLGVKPASVRRMLKRGLISGTGAHKKLRFPRAEVERVFAARREGIGPTTLNHYVVAVKSFVRWLRKKKRIPEDYLDGLATVNADTDLRHRRRPLLVEDFVEFLKAAREGGTFRGLTGYDRFVLYQVSGRTGLRASELASLTPASFSGLDGKQPQVVVEAAYSKHRREDTLPLHKDLVPLLREYLAGRPRDEAVWPGTWPAAGAEMLRADLDAAGIPYRDEAGRVFDFHALRHAFITHLVENGIHPKVAQLLARHSTIKLTMDRYTHMNALDVGGDLDKLPGLAECKTSGKASGATGKKGQKAG